MKKFMFILLCLCFGWMSFAEDASDPFYFLQDDQIIIIPQRSIVGKPYVDKTTGVFKQSIEGYKLTLLILKEFDGKILDGYKEEIFVKDSAPFTIQIDNGDGTFSYNEQIVQSVEEIEFDRQKYVKVMFLLPPNYSRVFFGVDAVFTPEENSKEFREEETRVVTITIANSEIVQPKKSSKSSSTSVVQSVSNDTSTAAPQEPLPKAKTKHGMR